MTRVMCTDGAAVLQDDIETFMGKEGSAEAALEKLQRFYRFRVAIQPMQTPPIHEVCALIRSACKMIEQRLVQRKAKLKVQCCARRFCVCQKITAPMESHVRCCRCR